MHLTNEIDVADFENEVEKNFNPHFDTDFNLFLSFSRKSYMVQLGPAQRPIRDDREFNFASFNTSFIVRSDELLKL